MSDLQKYAIRVKLLASKRTGEPFYNGSPDHAAIIIEQLFLNAKSTISLLSDDLDARVYGRQEIVQKVAQFLGHANHKMKVLVEEETFSASHPFLEVIKGEPNAELRRILPQDVPHVAYNFTLSDDDSYRYEPSKRRREAIAAFGDKLGAEPLRRTFDAIWSRATPIDMATLENHTWSAAE